MRDIALLRAARSPRRGTCAPMRLALTRPASASRLAEHAVGPPGAVLPARCAAQSCEKQGGLLSLNIVQRGCESSTAPVLWCESLIDGWQPPAASTCAVCSPARCRGMLVDEWRQLLNAVLGVVQHVAILLRRWMARGVRRAARGVGGPRHAAVGQLRGACAPWKLLDRRLAWCERVRRYHFQLAFDLRRLL